MLKLFDRSLLLLISRILLLCVGFFCYAYSIWTAHFAEIHVQLEYLDFPIFIGEILLCFCFLLLLTQYFIHPIRINRWFVGGAILYAVWVLVKVFGGYADGGPLAFRNAALFYYPFFVWVGFVIFDKGLFNSGWRWVVFGFIFLNLFFVTMNDYFAIGYLTLTLGFFYHLKNNWLKAFGILAVIFYVYQSKIMWWGIRSHLVGIGLMLMFLVIYFLFGMWRAGWLRKMAISTIGAGLTVIFLFNFCEPDILKSMLNIAHLQKEFSRLDQDINQKKRNYITESLKVNLYHASLTPVSIVDKAIVLSELAKVLPAQHSLHSKSQYLIQNESNLPQTKEGEPNLNLSDSTWLTWQELNENHPTRDRPYLGGSNQIDLPRNRSLDVVHSEGALDSVWVQKEVLTTHSKATTNTGRDLDIMYNNIFFRIFIWRDMLVDLKDNKAWLGMSFGHPQRSISIEILDWATTEWRRDGWITPHNSFLHMIYRGGIIGLLCVVVILGSLFYLTLGFLKHRSVWGGLLLAWLVYWVGISNFLVFLEFPYNAIPFWTLFGLTIAYYHSLEKGKMSRG